MELYIDSEVMHDVPGAGAYLYCGEGVLVFPSEDGITASRGEVEQVSTGPYALTQAMISVGILLGILPIDRS